MAAFTPYCNKHCSIAVYQQNLQARVKPVYEPLFRNPLRASFPGKSDSSFDSNLEIKLGQMIEKRTL
jgi:hypothetical protein